MPDSKDPRTQLLADTLRDEWSSGPMSDFARRAAAHARRRRVQRRVVVIASAAALLVLAIVRNAPSSVPAPQATAASSYEIISDAEFMAVLQDRPLLVLPNQNGSSKLVVLDAR
jgi:hypothetical protein